MKSLLTVFSLAVLVFCVTPSRVSADIQYLNFADATGLTAQSLTPAEITTLGPWAGNIENFGYAVTNIDGVLFWYLDDGPPLHAVNLVTLSDGSEALTSFSFPSYIPFYVAWPSNITPVSMEYADVCYGDNCPEGITKDELTFTTLPGWNIPPLPTAYDNQQFFEDFAYTTPEPTAAGLFLSGLVLLFALKTIHRVAA